MRLIYLLPFAIAAVLISACGDDGADNTATPTAGVTATATPGDATPPPNGDGDQNDDTATPLGPSDTEADIRLREFAINPGRTSAQPGTVTFNVRNEGEIQHEFVVIRTDLGHADLPRLDNNEGVDESELDVIGRTDPIDPGDEAQLEVQLDAGSYVLICNLTSDSTSHYLRGMYDRFTVSETAPPPETPVE